MAVAVGIGYAEVAELDAAAFDALETAAAKWSPDRELLATIAELSSANLVAFLSAHSTKRSKPLEPLRIPRPETDGVVDRSSSSTVRVGAAAFARMFGGRVEGPG